jgi:hypothetical protein
MTNNWNRRDLEGRAMLVQTLPARPATASGLTPEVIRVASSPGSSSLAAACGGAASGVVVRKMRADLFCVGILYSPSSGVAATAAAAPGTTLVSLLATATISGSGSGAGASDTIGFTPFSFPLPVRLTRLAGNWRHLLYDVERHLCIDVGVGMYRVGSPTGQERLLHPFSAAPGTADQFDADADADKNLNPHNAKNCFSSKSMPSPLLEVENWSS